MKEVDAKVAGLEIVIGELLIALRESDSQIAEDLKARLERQLSNETLGVTEHNTILNQSVLL